VIPPAPPPAEAMASQEATPPATPTRFDPVGTRRSSSEGMPPGIAAPQPAHGVPATSSPLRPGLNLGGLQPPALSACQSTGSMASVASPVPLRAPPGSPAPGHGIGQPRQTSLAGLPSALRNSLPPPSPASAAQSPTPSMANGGGGGYLLEEAPSPRPASLLASARRAGQATTPPGLRPPSLGTMRAESGPLDHARGGAHGSSRLHRCSDSSAMTSMAARRAAQRESGGEVVIDISPAFNPYLHHFSTSAPDNGTTVRCRVVRTRGKKAHVSYRMVTEHGEELLSAVRRSDDFLIAMTSSELLGDDANLERAAPLDYAKSKRQSFSVLRGPPPGEEDSQKRLFFAYDAVYDGRDVHATGEAIIAISQGTIVASADLPQVNTMRVSFAHPAAGQGEGAQPMSNEQLVRGIDSMEQAAVHAATSANMSPWESGALHRYNANGRAGNAGAVPPGMCLLESRVPVWNSRTESYVLNFHGRATLASSKNLQLVNFNPGELDAQSLSRPPSVPGSRKASPPQQRGAKPAQRKGELPTFLFGKVDRDLYNLDYQYPLSAFHAFAIAVSVTDW